MYKTIKKLREEKHFSQEAMAHALGLTQSQYCRRENGEIKFSADDIPLLAKELETSVAHLYGEEKTSFSIHTQNGGYFGQYVTVPEKLIEQYEVRIKEKDEYIIYLKNRLSQYE